MSFSFFCLCLGGNSPRGNTADPLLQLVPQSWFWRASASDHPVRGGLSTPWLSPSQQFQRVSAGTLLTGINESTMLVTLAFVDLFIVQSTKSCATRCDPMDCSKPGFPVLRGLLKFSHSCILNPWCYPYILSSVAPFSSCPQSFPASGSFPMSRSLHQQAKVFELQHQSFQWIFRVNFL